MPPVLCASWAGGCHTLRGSNAGCHGAQAELRALAAPGVLAPLKGPSRVRSESGGACKKAVHERQGAGCSAGNAGGDARLPCKAPSTDPSTDPSTEPSTDLPGLLLRRRQLGLSATLLPSVGIALRPELAGAAEPGGPSTAASSPPPESPSGGGRPLRPASQVVDLRQWQLIVGEGFVLQVPPGWQDLTPREDEGGAPQSTVMMQNKAQKTPFVARFASPDSAELISVVLQQASKVKLTFLEVDDVTALGSISEAARLFVSPGARIVASREFQAAWIGKRPRTYYLYEFVSGGQHTAMSVSASAGYLFVLGASAPEDKWRPAAARLRAAAGAFQLTV